MKKVTHLLALLSLFGFSKQAFAAHDHLYLKCESYSPEDAPRLMHYTKDHSSGYVKLRYFSSTFTWVDPRSSEIPFGFDGTGVPAEGGYRIYCDANSKATLRKVVIDGKNYYESHAFTDTWDYTYFFREDECHFHPFEQPSYQRGEVLNVGFVRQVKRTGAEIYLKVEESPNKEFPFLINIWSNDGIRAANFGTYVFMDGNPSTPIDDGVIWGYAWPVDEPGYQKDSLLYDFNKDGTPDLLRLEPVPPPFDVIGAYRLVIEIR